MREIFRNASIVITVDDDPDDQAGGANHRYTAWSDATGLALCTVEFQHGPVKEAGVNGIQHVHLLAIIQHRLDSFQRGPFASAINEVTNGFVSAAMASEDTRTRRRQAAGVEGQNVLAIGVEK